MRLFWFQSFFPFSLESLLVNIRPDPATVKKGEYVAVGQRGARLLRHPVTVFVS